MARQGTRRRHYRGGRLVGARQPGCSNATNTTGKEAKQRGDHGGAHLGQQTARRAAVVTHGGGAAPPGSGDDGGSLWWTSGSERMMGSFAAGSSTSSQPSIEASGGGRWRAMVAARVLGLDVLRDKI
jgi:hypothetical protein